AGYNLGTLFEAQQEPEKGLGCYQPLLQWAPDFQPARANMAKLYLRSHQPQQTLEVLSQAAAPHAEFANLKGMAHSALGQTAAAHPAFQHELQLESGFTGARYKLGLLHEENGYDQQSLHLFETIL